LPLDDLDAGFGFQDHPESGPAEFLIIGQQDVDHARDVSNGRVAWTSYPAG